MGLELEVEPELLPLPELPVLFFRKVAYGFELSCGEGSSEFGDCSSSSSSCLGKLQLDEQALTQFE